MQELEGESKYRACDFMAQWATSDCERDGCGFDIHLQE